MEPDKTLYLARDMDRPELLRGPGGVAAVFTRRRPEATRQNQDAAAVLMTPDGDWLLVVTDGVGGARSGGKAAAIAVERVLHAASKADPTGLRPAVIDGIEAANDQILRMRVGAGATLAAAAVVDGALRTFHVGDCMALVVGQRGRIKLHTVAHSPVGFAFAAGYMDEAEAMSAPYRHLILNVLGSPEMRTEVGIPTPLAARDTLLIASDGLFDNLYAYEIAELIRKGPLDVTAAALAAACAQRMAKDGSSEPDEDGSEEPDEEAPHKPDDLTFILFRRR